MTITTIGYGDVPSGTTAERVVSIVCMILGARQIFLDRVDLFYHVLNTKEKHDGLNFVTEVVAKEQPLCYLK